MSSEELSQRGLTKKGITIIDFEFFPLHSTTLKQYKKSNIIPNKDYNKYEIRKPDGLLVDRANKSKPKVIAVLEYKKPSEFQTDKQKREAIEQCNDLCQELESQIGIITDGIVTYWINPNHPDKNIVREIRRISDHKYPKGHKQIIFTDVWKTYSKYLEEGIGEVPDVLYFDKDAYEKTKQFYLK